ncbi:Lipase/vitellogenin,Triacylglycerol lipase family,Alpha/Beta hydrolase fold [Cinara cedri]|uniref:Lipase/vitellogenin,Triacylglycerol lipase family,Alpha/Beta hydrolase fold n=1 Tax=Cinara cedri TaxID=506608 RepID=A0A5E4MNJ9_9HEMI|nr:Lipase/vitellogenin,Triacylglycerol lipase family,Alpha/Beta hydrolase fold [Cinara cedri]
MFAFKKVFFEGVTLLAILTICADNGKGTTTENDAQMKEMLFKKQLTENVATITNILQKDDKDKCPNNYVKFYLYTQQDNKGKPIPTEVSEGTEHIILNSINPINLKIMIHGAYGHKDDAFNILIRKSYFTVDSNRNILVVDYKFLGDNLIGMPYRVYDVVELVAKCTVRILYKIIKENSGSIINTHVIGFSLGAQIAGSLANKLKITNNGGFSHTISRITALEPVLLNFEGKRSILNKDSAPIVDVLYTNFGSLGQIFPIGTHIFYANGGLCQPKCDIFDNDGYNCSHKRAYTLFAESIEYKDPKYGFFSKRRGHNEPMSFLLGLKNKIIYDSAKYKFGEYLETNQEKVDDGVFYFETNSQYPFAQDIDCTTEERSTYKNFNFISTIISSMTDWWSNHPPLHEGTPSYQSSQYEGPLFEEEIIFD